MTAYLFRIFGGYTMATKIVMVVLGLTLVLVVACGTAEAPEPTAAPDPTAADAAPAAEPTAAPAESDTSQPTAVPQVADPPADVEVNPGKLTIMVGDFGTERFDNAFTGGGPGALNHARVLHGFLISDNEKREMIQGNRISAE
jgi:hypothetical protein